MDAPHAEADAEWTPKTNPFDLIIGSGAHMPVPFDEVHRLERLRAFNLAEMSFNEDYAAVVQTAMRIFDAEMGCITVLDESVVYLKVNLGPLHEAACIGRNQGFCAFTLMPGAPDVLVVKDALKDSRFKNCLLTANHGVRFYAGTNLQIEDGTTFGTLCVMSNSPRTSFPVKDQAILVSLARTVSLMVRQERQEVRNALQRERPALLSAQPSSSSTPTAVEEPAPNASSYGYRPLTEILQSCTSALRAFYPLAPLRVDCGELMATRVLLKEPLLRQCVLTLLTSACQQWNHGQEILAPITVTAHRREGLLRVDVHDPQLFIDAIAAEDLFSSHMLSNDSLDFSNSSNFGQGLTAVKQSLQSVGGNCGWEWHEVSGVVLSIELPCLFYTDEHPAEAPTAEVPTEQAAHETAPTSTKAIDHAATLFQKAIIPALVGRRILLADTNALHRHVLREELLWQGVERVDEAKDGQHALQLMRELNYDVVVLDLVLPVLNGLECLKELEIAKAAGSHVPIVFGMSNAAEREDIALAFEYGMRAFFNKPADVEDICAMICRLLEKTPPQTANGLASPEGETRSISQPGLASPAHDPESPPPRSAMRRLVRLGQRLRRLFGNLPLRLQRGTSRGTSIEEHPSKPEKTFVLVPRRTYSFAASTPSTDTRSTSERRSAADVMGDELDYLLATPARRTDFVRFCVHELSVENVKFLIAVNDARRYLEKHVQDEDQLQLQHTMLFFVTNIYRTYIASGGPHELNLSASVAKVAKAVYNELFAQKAANSTPAAVVLEEMLEWLAPSYDEVFTMVCRDTWHRFMRTGDYARFKTQVNCVADMIAVEITAA